MTNHVKNKNKKNPYKADVLATQFVTLIQFVTLKWQPVLKGTFSTWFVTPSLISPPLPHLCLHWGTMDAEIKISVENPDLWKSFPLKAWSRSEYRHTCFVQEFFFPLNFLFWSTKFHFFLSQLQGKWNGVAAGKACKATFWILGLR